MDGQSTPLTLNDDIRKAKELLALHQAILQQLLEVHQAWAAILERYTCTVEQRISSLQQSAGRSTVN